MEDAVGIDPHQLVESLSQGIAGHLVACGINGRVAAHAPYGVATPFQLTQSVLALRVDGAADGHEDDAARRGSHIFDLLLLLIHVGPFSVCHYFPLSCERSGGFSPRALSRASTKSVNCPLFILLVCSL